MKIIFWLCFVLIVYHYFLFPVILFLMSHIKTFSVKKGFYSPTVSLIIAALNEEDVIKEKIMNSLSLCYPEDKIEIIVVSDGSTDRTSEIANAYCDRGVKGLHQIERRGKTAALNRGVSVARGEVIVFSDANSMYDAMAVKRLVENFSDSSIGGVSGRKTIVQNNAREASGGDSLFWSFESFMKILQSRAGSITTGDGEIFAIKRELYSMLSENIINDDTAITFNIVEKGFRVVYEPDAISEEEASIALKDDFNVKARMVAGGYQTITLYSRMLFPPMNFFAIQFLSHKLLRWAMPIFLIFLFLSNLMVQGMLFYRLLLLLQVFFYLSAGIGLYLKIKKEDMGKFYYPLYYCTVNLAALKGLYFFLSKRVGVNIWKKAKRI